MKGQMETERQKKIVRKASNAKEMETLNKGKKTIKTMFMSKKSTVNKITSLKHKIEDAEKQIECFDLYLKVITL